MHASAKERRPFDFTNVGMNFISVVASDRFYFYSDQQGEHGCSECTGAPKA